MTKENIDFTFSMTFEPTLEQFKQNFNYGTISTAIFIDGEYIIWNMNPKIIEEQDALSVIIYGSSTYKKWSEKFLTSYIKLKLLNSRSETLTASKFHAPFVVNQEFAFERVVKSFVTSNCLQSWEGWAPIEPLLIMCHVSLVKLPSEMRYRSKEVQTKGTNKSTSDSTCSSANPEKQWNVNNFTDFTIECKDGSVLNVHKSILELKCPILMREISKFKHEDKITFANSDPRAVKSVLNFIYTNSLGDLSAGIEFEIIELSQKLGIEEVAEKCCTKLMSNITNETAVETLIFSQENRLNSLKVSTMKFIALNLEQIRQLKSWEKLTKFPDLLKEVFVHFM